MTTPVATTRDDQRQNPHLTFRHNLHQGRHGWLRLTPAYSVKLVSEILDGGKYAASVLDPFSGTGTTALCAAYLGLRGTGLEINPFLVWFSSAKSKQYSPSTIQQARELGRSISFALSSPRSPRCDPPPIHNISRWWNERELDFLCRLKACICDAAPDGSEERDLLLVAFCRTVITLSNAAFNHQSMSFKNKDTSPRLFDVQCDHSDVFRKELTFVLDGAADNPPTTPHILTGDARQSSRYLRDKYDVLITSPPYPNNYDYADATRLEMSFLREIEGWGCLQDKVRRHLIRSCSQHVPEKAVNLQAVLSYPELEPIRAEITEVCEKLSDIRQTKGGRKTYHLMVACYFADLAKVWHALRRVCQSPSKVCFVIGDSAPYGVYVPVVPWLGTLATTAGFKSYTFEKTRDRNIKWKNRKHRVPLQEGRLWVQG